MKIVAQNFLYILMQVHKGNLGGTTEERLGRYLQFTWKGYLFGKRIHLIYSKVGLPALKS